MDWAVEPFDQVLLFKLEEVNVTDSPVQNVVGPLALIVGIAGKELTVTKVGSDAVEQFPFVTDTEYVPLWLTIIDWLVEPFDQTLFDKLEDVNVTEPPVQKDIGPLWLIVGADGEVLTVIIVGSDVDEQLPFETVTEYVPLWFNVIDWAVEPFDQTLFDKLEDVNVTDPPEQKVVGPLLLITGMEGRGFTFTSTGVDVEEQPPLVTVTE